MTDQTKTLDELDRLHGNVAGKFTNRADMLAFADAMTCFYPALRSHIAGLEAKAAGFDLIRDMFHRFDTRFAGARDQVLLTDDLLERTREAIESAVKKETE